MQESIDQQFKELQEQIKLYKEEGEKKKLEEAELTKVMIDYKSKFNEFDKSIKMSRKNLTQYEKEISNMNKKI